MSRSPVPARLYHLDGEVDPDGGRHWRAVRRGWLTIVAGALIGALAFGLLNLGSDYRGATTLEVTRSSPDLENLGIPFDNLIETATGPTLTAELENTDFEQASEAELGGEIDVEVVDASRPDGVQLLLTISSADEERTERAVDLYRNEFERLVQSKIDRSATQLVETIDVRLESGDERIEALEARLVELDPASSLAEALGVERADIETELRLLSDQRRALQSFIVRGADDSPSATIDEISGVAVAFVAGALLGALLGFGVVLATSVFKRRVVARRDLDVTTAGPVLAVVALDTPGHVATMAAALLHAAPSSPIVLAPVDDAARAAAERLAEALPPHGIDAPTVVGPPQLGIAGGADEAAYVIVVVLDATSTLDFRMAAAALDDAGRSAVGSVLVVASMSEYHDAFA